MIVDLLLVLVSEGRLVNFEVEKCRLSCLSVRMSICESASTVSIMTARLIGYGNVDVCRSSGQASTVKVTCFPVWNENGFLIWRWVLQFEDGEDALPARLKVQY